jgi:predicted MPP superfamily phosphohydrolase
MPYNIGTRIKALGCLVQWEKSDDDVSMKKKMSPALLVFTAILFFSYFYIGIRLASNSLHWVVLLFLFTLLFSFPFVHWHYEAVSWPRAKVLLQRSIYLALGFSSWLLVLTFVRDILIFFTFLFGGPFIADHMVDFSSGFPLFFIALALTFAGTWQAYYGVHLHEISVPISNLPADLDGFRIAQISDLHVGPTIGEKYVRKVVDLVKSAKPDITALTGDIGDGLVASLKESIQPLKELSPAGRIFYVPGNHEYYWKVDEWLAEFAKLGATVLNNCGIRIDHNGKSIWIGGVSDPAGTLLSRENTPNVKKAASGSEGSDFKLLLSHRPSLAQAASDAGFNLQLSGHTHGGQFWPWTYVVQYFHLYVMGLVRHDKIWLYVSPGTGSWGPPMRVGTTPEVTLLKLQKA